MPPSSRNKKRQRPLAPAPLRSLKRARKVTTVFHRLSRQLTAAEAKGDETEIARITKEIEEAGGREAYQQASQVSTAVHSTSKWVVSYMVGNGWSHGVPVDDGSGRRSTRLLEVGAINTQLLEAAQRSNGKLAVTAIDLKSSHAGIEEADFLHFPLPDDGAYDVIVCSMVLNCVNTAEDRGKMICRLYDFTVPNGLVFMTIPKTCLELSPYLDIPAFSEILEAVGFEIAQQKSSPKLCFFILRRGSREDDRVANALAQWGRVKVIRRGKKYRKNDFSVVLGRESLYFKNPPEELATGSI